VAYGYIGSMKAKPGRRDEVVSALLSSIDVLRVAGCDLYVVSVSATDDDTIWVTEIWPTKQHHDSSLQLPQVKSTIGTTMPLLTGEFTRQELSVVGGLGLGLGHALAGFPSVTRAMPR
jgi:quinol monooxygenase YgiN